jgi:lipoprotein-releasing system ATP-binding protein
VLEVSHVAKEYPTPRGPLPVLTDVSFSLAAGEAAVIMGPSGSGKSSLLYILGAMEPPTSGTIRLAGQDPFALTPTALARYRNTEIGFVFQDHCLLPQCSVLENVLVPTLVGKSRSIDSTLDLGPSSLASAEKHGQGRRSKVEGQPADADPERLARTLIEEVGLLDRIDHRPAELSGGEKQRVAIARALIRNPRLLLCDEPTGNLDQKAAESVTALLLELHRLHQSVLITVTHSIQLASKFPIRFELANTNLVRVDSPAAVTRG